MTELLSRLRSAYGEEEAAAIAGGYSRPVTLRVNTLKATADEVVSALSKIGISSERVPWYSAALVTDADSASVLEQTPLYAEGKIYLQSLSSMLPPLYLAPEAGESVLDMTAAPGGKTSEMFALSGGKALITACERDKIRFERLKFNLARQGVRSTVLHCDAATLSDYFVFDKILLDAPCSGSGTAVPGRTPRMDEGYLSRCTRLQETLLQKGLRLLKKGGTLVYSTCSVLPEEDGLLIEKVLRETGARLIPIRPPEGAELLSSLPGTVCIRPNARYEGFFLAKLTH